jgi:ABC-type bacteriocin/lantibiotic exporter with double-glycine peptidase domain
LFGGTVSTSLIVLIIVVVAGVFFNGVLQVLQMQATERIQQRIFARLTFAYAYRIPRINLLSVDDYYLPELVNRFFDTAGLQKGMSKLLIDFPAATIQVFFGLILLCFYHPVFIAFAFLLIAIVLIIFYLTGPLGFRTSMQESDYKYSVAHWLEEISRSIKTFKFHQSHELHLKKTDELVSGYLYSRNAHFAVLVSQYKVLIGFKVLITASMLIIGSILFIKQQINLGQFIAAEIIIITVLNSIEKMIVSLEVVYDVLTSHEKLNKVLDKPNDHDRSSAAPRPFAETPGIDIKIYDLDFGYPNKKEIIKKLNLQIKAGEKVCITGSEGSGKSTLLRLLTGIYPDFSGNILFNDVPLKLIPRADLHARVAVYLSEEELFSGSLLENLTVGNDKISFEDIYKACEIVGLHTYTNQQPEGYQTMLDPQGKKLSYNTIQKILLARCLLMKPSLLLMEDGWMSVEPAVKDQVIDYLTDTNNAFTLIAVSNDLTFGGKCTRVLQMDKGALTQ